ncbi:WXG100 family type VII secretion target [Microbacterium sp. P01]|uniref:WXG100 family type VII secretion target n=1 Tax=unclassified Microbacterium TaxID=2609290 RepID=UPI003672CF21
MSDLKVTPESLHAGAAELRSESAHIAGVLAGLEQEVGRLRAQWDGGAQQAYDQAQRSWSRTFDEMKTLLARVADATDRMAEEYVTQDKNSAGRFTAV